MDVVEDRCRLAWCNPRVGTFNPGGAEVCQCHGAACGRDTVTPRSRVSQEAKTFCRVHGTYTVYLFKSPESE